MIKKCKIIILLILLLIPFKSAFAANCDNLTFWAQKNRFSYKPNISLNGVDNEILRVNTQKSSGNLYTSYCLNPGWTTGIQSYPTMFTCMAKLLDKNSSDEKLAYEYGIISLISNGISMQNGINYNNGKLNVNQENVATTMALRLYSMFWTSQYDNNNNTSNLYKIYKGYFNSFRTDKTISNLVTKLDVKYNMRVKKMSGTSSSRNWKGINKNSLENEVKRLVIEGLKGAINYTNNGVASINWNDVPLINNNEVKNNLNQTFYKSSIIYIFNAKNFTLSPSLKISFNCENCISNHVDYELFLQYGDNKDFVSVGKTLPDSLLSYLNNGTGSFKIKVEFKGIKDEYNCENIKYKFNVEYKDNTVSTTAYKIKASNNKVAKRQRFIVIFNSNAMQKKEISNSIRLCKASCHNLERGCQNGNADDCKEFEKNYNSSCVLCTSSITNPQCSNSDTILDIKEGYEEGEKTCDIPTKQNIKQCIINSEDKLGNSYEATNIISENNYCSVWCKEDYSITLPGQKNSASGRFISLSAKIKGIKTCYTSKIDKEAFNNDIRFAEQELKDVYNVWNSIKNDANSNKLNASINKIKQIINSYMNCSAWTMDYNFNPKIEFFYEEEYMKYLRNNVFETKENIVKTPVKIDRCNVEADNTYTNCSTNWQDELETEDFSVYNCQFSNNTYNCNNEIVKIPTVVNMKESMEVTANYEVPSQFFTVYPTGTIVSGQYNSSILNASLLENRLPIGLNTKRGIYNYVLKIKDLGEYYDSNNIGRIWGNGKNLISNYIEEKKTCGIDSYLKDELSINGNKFNNGLYVCEYIVNIDNCKNERDNYCNPNCPDDPDCNSCLKKKDKYYCRNGEICSESKYYDECGKCSNEKDGYCDLHCLNDPDCPYACTKKENKYYCRDGKECSEDFYKKQCSENGNPPMKYSCVMTIENNEIVYYDGNGNKTTADVFSASCCPNGHCGTCKYCLYDGDNLRINFRQISNENINPNERELGINWQYNDDLTKNDDLSLKAYKTTDEIIKNGNNIYDIDFENTNSEDFAMKIDMDSKMLNAIKHYNKINHGVYNEDSLTCYNYEKDGALYENIFCYSKFIDYLQNDKDLAARIKFTIDRPLSEEDRKNTANFNYWTIWTDFVLTENANVGPSWK